MFQCEEQVQVDTSITTELLSLFCGNSYYNLLAWWLFMKILPWITVKQKCNLGDHSTFQCKRKKVKMWATEWAKRFQRLQIITPTFSEFWSARASACFFSSETFFWQLWQKPPFSSDSEMGTDPAPSGGGRLLHCASSAEWSLFLGVAGDSPPGHPSTFGTSKGLVNFRGFKKE